MTTERKKKSETMTFLENLTGGPLTIANMLADHCEGEEITQAELADELGISAQNLNDIIRGRKLVSPSRAAKFAIILGESERQWIRIATQDYLRSEGYEFVVTLDDAA